MLFGLDIKQGNFMLSSSVPKINMMNIDKANALGGH